MLSVVLMIRLCRPSIDLKLDVPWRQRDLVDYKSSFVQENIHIRILSFDISSLLSAEA